MFWLQTWASPLVQADATRGPPLTCRSSFLTAGWRAAGAAFAAEFVFRTTLEFLLHYFRRTPELTRSIAISMVDREALAEWLADADLFVHPNPREPFGIGPLEAMACGLPVVVPDRGGVRSYANNENAWLAKPCGSDLARAVSLALTHPSERERRCRRGLETAAQLAWPTAAAKFFDLYYEIASWHSRVYAGRHPQRWLRADIATHEEVS